MARVANRLIYEELGNVHGRKLPETVTFSGPSVDLCLSWYSREPAMSSDIEKAALEVRFIPILCAAPLLYAHSQGLCERHGLRLNLQPAPGWSAVKELLVYEKIDAAHVLTPMPLACALGLDGKPAPLRLGLVQNLNGQALTLASRHVAIRDPRQLRGLRIGVPYEFSMQSYLLRAWLAEHGVDPCRDVEIKEVSPPRMPSYLEKGWLDGMLAPEPYNQLAVARGVGFIAFTSQDLWPGHPCCGFAFHRETLERRPQAMRALLTSIVQAQRELRAASPSRRQQIAEILSAPAYLNQSDPRHIASALSGQFPDGRDGDRSIASYIDFTPHLAPELGDWLLSQMQRWGQLSGRLDYAQTVEAVFATELSTELARAEGVFDNGPLRRQGAELPRGEAAFAAMLAAPYCRYRAAAPPPPPPIPPALSERITTMLGELAEVAGGRSELALDVSVADELGWLARMLNEVVLNLCYVRQALGERLALDHLAQRQQQQLELQTELVRQLAVPIIPVFSGILVVPLIGRITGERSQQILGVVLQAAVQQQAQIVLLDITGVPQVDDIVVENLLRLRGALQLLGVHSGLVGMSALLARQFVAVGHRAQEFSSHADLQSGLAHALASIGFCIVSTKVARAPLQKRSQDKIK